MVGGGGAAYEALFPFSLPPPSCSCTPVSLPPTAEWKEGQRSEQQPFRRDVPEASLSYSKCPVCRLLADMSADSHKTIHSRPRSKVCGKGTVISAFP